MTSLGQPAPGRLTGDDLIRLKKFLADNLMRALENEGVPVSQRNTFVQKNIAQIYEQTQLRLPEDLRKQIFEQVLNDLLGYGPIQSLLNDEQVTEIMVNGPKKVFIEKEGKLIKSNVAFDDDDHVLRIIDRIILPLGRHVDADSPTVDARL
ncbi:MAG: Flp pilus assembly complex ATPase component TadA, partial [Chloroflexi bacterium]|nr:Flp pilus assembly complex ATPase component TadA [Chloroflexota bacterium]